jgi:hypothetical protein
MSSMPTEARSIFIERLRIYLVDTINAIDDVEEVRVDARQIQAVQIICSRIDVFVFVTKILYLSAVKKRPILQVRRLSDEFGAYHVRLRRYGFKPDFFAIIADIVATECVFLGGNATAMAPATFYQVFVETLGSMIEQCFAGLDCRHWFTILSCS